MINLFSGPNGSGKTQKLINHANEELEKTQGLIVYIDKSDKHRLSIKNAIRFIDAKEFGIENADAFYGFICGILSGNYDINRIYIDNLYRIINTDSEDSLMAFIGRLERISSKCQTDFYFTHTTESSAQLVELVYTS
ncbi:MAG: hypothetical protein FWG30_01365 [Eubacteriaceae bacterium]|nr:hypothetical protein [Eubacteriaceae bacterium]